METTTIRYAARHLCVLCFSSIFFCASVKGDVLYTTAEEYPILVSFATCNDPCNTSVEKLVFGIMKSAKTGKPNVDNTISELGSNSLICVVDNSLRYWRTSLETSMSVHNVSLENIFHVLPGIHPFITHYSSDNIHYFFRRNEISTKHLLRVRGRNYSSLNLDELNVAVKTQNGEHLSSSSTFVSSSGGFYTAFVEYTRYIPSFIIGTNLVCSVTDSSTPLTVEIIHGQKVVGRTVIEHPLLDPEGFATLSREEQDSRYSDRQLADAEYGFWFMDGHDSYIAINDIVYRAIDVTSLTTMPWHDELLLSVNAVDVVHHVMNDKPPKYHFMKIDNLQERNVVFDILGYKTFILPRKEKPAGGHE